MNCLKNITFLQAISKRSQERHDFPGRINFHYPPNYGNTLKTLKEILINKNLWYFVFFNKMFFWFALHNNIIKFHSKITTTPVSIWYITHNEKLKFTAFLLVEKKEVKSKTKLKRIIEVYLFSIRTILKLPRCAVDIIKKNIFRVCASSRALNICLHMSTVTCTVMANICE